MIYYKGNRFTLGGIHMLKLKRKFGDRYDGYRVKNVDPFFLLIPYIMKTRVDSQVYFSDRIEITELEKFVREHASTDIEGLRMYHVVTAAIVRLLSQRPYLNRFVAGNKIYARNHISISMSVKKSMTDEAETTVVKPIFSPYDVLRDIVNKFNEEVNKNKVHETENKTDFTAKLVGNLPSFLIRFVIGTLHNLDKIGLMPKLINKVSPFHTSVFITNMGSLGIKPIYHHIYEFGTTSVFIAMGKKYSRMELDNDGNAIKRKYIDIKVVADERICDGHYYALSMRMLAKIFKNPEILLRKPDSVVLDDGIIMKGRVKKSTLKDLHEESEIMPSGI